VLSDLISDDGPLQRVEECYVEVQSNNDSTVAAEFFKYSLAEDDQ
jgi:hypothetical protein